MSFHETNIVCTNAVEMATRIISKIAGGVVSNNIAGQPINNETLSQAVAAKMQAKLKLQTGVAK